MLRTLSIMSNRLEMLLSSQQLLETRTSNLLITSLMEPINSR